MASPSRVPVPTYRLRHVGPRSHRSSTFMRDRAERANSTPPQASLLGIPGELRNRINRMVLVKDTAIIITATNNHEQPGLLRTCRQLRTETRSIFEEENDFGLEVINVRPRLPIRYGFHWSGPLITHGYFNHDMTICKHSRMLIDCLLTCRCEKGHEAVNEWEERGTQTRRGAQDSGEEVGWCFHATMGAALRRSSFHTHARTKFDLCASVPELTEEGFNRWLEVTKTMPFPIDSRCDVAQAELNALRFKLIRNR